MATQEEMNYLNTLVKNTGVEYVETEDINDSVVYNDEYDYVGDLNKHGMLNDQSFDKLNVDWGHVKKVMEHSDKKYGHIGCATKKELYNEDKKREKMTKIVELMLEIIKDN